MKKWEKLFFTKLLWVNVRRLGTILLSRRLMLATTALGLLSVFGFVQTELAQTTQPLNFGNNYFVTGDYVVGGVGLRGLGVNGFATGTINIPDTNSVPATGVPAGADIVGAFLYWETVESSQSAFAGQQGFFRGYPITGVVLGNPNAPVSWSSGGCSGNAQGSKTMRGYRADVLGLLPVDSNGIVQPNGSYQVRLADSGSGGGGAPLTLGATLVVIYRILDKNVPQNSVIIYDGAYAPSNGSSTMTQALQGFYQAAASPISKLTHIVGNGQDNKFETVSLNGVVLPSQYGSLPSFPGFYNGSWDNPTWSFSGIGNPIHANDASATTMVVPAASNSGCVSWGVVILSTTVQDSDNDALLDVWEQNHGYCDASVNGGVCSTTDPSWVALPGATLGQRDVFVQIDYMCSIVNPDGTCNTTSGVSYLPPASALTMTTNAFSAQGINLHLIPTNAIQTQTCSDDYSTTPPTLCPFPGQSGAVGWKAGFAFLKNEPLNYPDETACVAATSPACIRRFQHGKKDSYHYIITANALAAGNWGFQGGSLMSVVVASNGVATFTTTRPSGLVIDAVAGNGRVTVADAITNSNLNGTYFVTGVNNTTSPYTFTIQTSNVPAGTYSLNTDPDLSAASGQLGTGSGVSDVGGSDSLITLGLWGVDGQTVPVQAGTFMHELGHSLVLTHGGFYFDTPNSYVTTVEANCKSNFQSVMNYLFQVDLLDSGVLDYSGQNLDTLNEQTLGGVTGLTPATNFSLTRWYRPLLFGDVGTAATQHCDGTPKLLTDSPMIRVEGATNPITPAWVNNQDINFDGQNNASLRGYNDWANIDLRQIGATGSLSVVGGITKGGTGITKGGTGITKGGTGITKGGTGITKGGTGITKGGTGVGLGEITHETANSFTRPPRNLTASLTPAPRYIKLNWMGPTFGQIGAFNVYRALNGTPVAPPYATVSGSTTTYTDQNVTCGPTYTYFVTAVLAGTNQESVPSNSVSLTACVPPYTFTGFYSPMATADPPNVGSYSGTFNKSKSITAKWTLRDSSGNLVTDVNVHSLRAIGPFMPLANGTCPSTQASGGSTLLFSPTGGAKGSSTLRFSTSQFVFNWDTKATPPSPTLGSCYALELSLDSGQVFKTGVKLQ